MKKAATSRGTLCLILVLMMLLASVFALSGCNLLNTPENSGSNSNEGSGGNDDGADSGENTEDGINDSALLCPVCGTEKCTSEVVLPATILCDGSVKHTCLSCGNSFTATIPATKSAKILLIGDATTQDVVKHLNSLLKAEGLTDVIIATMTYNYNTGATIDGHLGNINSGKKTYTITKMENGEKSMEYSKSFNEGLAAEDWDYIGLGQSIYLGGNANGYDNLKAYVEYVNANKTNANAKIFWQMGWALNSACTNSAFNEFDNDTDAMYEAITSITKDKVEQIAEISAILPIGTAVQSLRETALGDKFTNTGIHLQGDYGDIACYAASMIWKFAILGESDAKNDWVPETDTSREKEIYLLAKEAAMRATESNYKSNPPRVKSIKMLIFGNSYGNDATAYLEQMFNDGGYINVIIGHAGESSMAINDHYHNIDDDPNNDYIYKTTGKPFSVHYKTVNGIRVEMEADYKSIVADEDWDIVTFYQGPNNMATLTEESYYSELNNFTKALKKYSTNPGMRILYYMPWAHGSTNTAGYHKEICELTKKLFVGNETIDGIIPAGTVIQNLRSSYLNSSTDGKGDINRDWGHLNYGVGRYSIALLFYICISGGSPDDVKYIPTAEEISSRPFTDVESNLDVIREAVENAISKPFEMTASKYTEKVN